jgi:Zinc finger, C3HC4 type (RING finger)
MWNVDSTRFARISDGMGGLLLFPDPNRESLSSLNASRILSNSESGGISQILQVLGMALCIIVFSSSVSVWVILQRRRRGGGRYRDYRRRIPSVVVIEFDETDSRPLPRPTRLPYTPYDDTSEHMLRIDLESQNSHTHPGTMPGETIIERSIQEKRQQYFTAPRQGPDRYGGSQMIYHTDPVLRQYGERERVRHESRSVQYSAGNGRLYSLNVELQSSRRVGARCSQERQRTGPYESTENLNRIRRPPHNFTGSASPATAAVAVTKKRRPPRQRKGYRQDGDDSQQSENNSVSSSSTKEFVRKNKRGDAPDEVLCVICLVNRKNTVIQPCNHLCICDSCADSYGNTCPICRCSVIGTLRVYT